MRRSTRSAAIAAAALMLTAAGTAAQSCLGLPTRDGQMAVAATSGAPDGGDAQYGAEVDVDVTGPAAFGFTYSGLGSDDDRQIITGRLSYDFFLVDPSVCAVAGVLYDDVPGSGRDERLGVPIGLGFGKTLRGSGFNATVFAVPQYVWLRDTLQEPVPAGDDDVLTSSEFMVEAGVTFGLSAFYLGGSVVATTFEGSDPGFRLRAGLVF